MLRKVVADAIIKDKTKYNKEFLGEDMEPDEYAEWIQKPNSWGGHPELEILSKHFNKMIYVVDIKEGTIIKYDDIE